MKSKEKQKKNLKKNKNSKSNILVRLFRFFFPKNWQAELYKGRMVGDQIRRGKLTPKMMPTWWIGKGVRKAVDPKRRLSFEDKKEKEKEEKE